MAFGQDAADYRVELFAGYHADRGADGGRHRAASSSRRPTSYAAFGWESVAVPGLEADDVLGSFALAEQDAGGSALILTGDRDMFQCVNDRCTVLYMRTGGRGADVVDEAEVRSRYGVPPALVPDLIALRGDPPTASRARAAIGDKTAADLLQPPRLAGGRDRGLGRREPARARRRCATAGRRAARLQGGRDAAQRPGRAAAGPPHRPGRRRGGRARAGHEPPRRAARAAAADEALRPAHCER